MILLGLPENLLHVVTAAIGQIEVHKTTTPEDTIAALEIMLFDGVVIISDWTMYSREIQSSTIINLIRDKNIPSVVLITKWQNADGYDLFNKVFLPPKHEYCTVPFSTDELIHFMQLAGIVE